MLLVLLPSPDNQRDTVLTFVVEAHPGTHDGLLEEVELLIYPVLQLRTLQDDLTKVLHRVNQLFLGVTFLRFVCGCSILWFGLTFLDLFFSANVHIEDTII